MRADELSVLTLVRGRATHLRNLLRGLARQTARPREVVIAWMQPSANPDLPDPGCPVRHVYVPGEPMPLAAARNAAARRARGRGLLFLDVDCIPSDRVVAAYAEGLAARPGVHMSEVLYLPPGEPGAGPHDPARLDAAGAPHPSKRPFPDTGAEPERDHGELWGLSFALPAATWRAIGGMDERFTGYGGEETDFAAALAAARVPLWRLGGARVWHQHHPVAKPPLDRFAEIVANARRFHAKWGRWCMDYWLGQFASMGLVRLDDDRLTVLRPPTRGEIAASRRDPDARFS